MKRIIGFFIGIGILFVLSSCGPKVRTKFYKKLDPLDYKQEVLIIGVDEVVPDGAEELGLIKIGDSGFSVKCGYEVVMRRAKMEARKVGGNALKIITQKSPSIWNSCHSIKAKILKIDNIEELNLVDKQEQEILDVDYAILNVYRFSGGIVGYDLHLGDSTICRVRNNFKTTLHIKKKGLNSLWAKTEAKSEVPIDIQYGKTYYLKCSMSMGVLVGHPKIELVDWKLGKSEFESFKAKNK